MCASYGCSINCFGFVFFASSMSTIVFVRLSQILFKILQAEMGAREEKKRERMCVLGDC